MVSGTVLFASLPCTKCYSTPTISIQYNLLTEAMAWLPHQCAEGLMCFSGVIWRWREVNSNAVLLR